MAKEASSANQSLPLREVLEAEFKALHGERPLDSPTSTDPQNLLKALWIAVHGWKKNVLRHFQPPVGLDRKQACQLAAFQLKLLLRGRN